MRQLLRCFFLSLVIFLSSSALLFALDVPKRSEGYVSDYAGVLSSAARSRLERELRDFDEKTGNQVLVVIFHRLEGDILESYSIRLAEAWKPGQKGKDNGAILLIFKEDRRVRIEAGYVLEGVLTDALCKRIIENVIVPRFRAGDFDGGIEHAVAAIISEVQGEHSGERSSSPPVNAASVRVPGLMFLVLIIWFCVLAMRQTNASSFDRRGYYRGYGGIGGFGGGFSGGGGFGGGGGFSGGGGGFGGGGASGSW